ncbi:hypothetical protein F5Y12DRAFT_792244 [Xylaria sp. FL1777]|nr:hypothetical protein F5Y12DRAFT_792244 [Xylaria sp. FL1777]
MAAASTTASRLDLRAQAFKTALDRCLDEQAASYTQAVREFRQIITLFYSGFRSRGANRNPPKAYACGFALWACANLGRERVRYCIKAYYHDTTPHLDPRRCRLVRNVVRIASSPLLTDIWDVYLFFGPYVARGVHGLTFLAKALDAVSTVTSSTDKSLSSSSAASASSSISSTDSVIHVYQEAIEQRRKKLDAAYSGVGILDEELEIPFKAAFIVDAAHVLTAKYKKKADDADADSDAAYNDDDEAHFIDELLQDGGVEEEGGGGEEGEEEEEAGHTIVNVANDELELGRCAYAALPSSPLGHLDLARAHSNHHSNHHSTISTKSAPVRRSSSLPRKLPASVPLLSSRHSSPKFDVITRFDATENDSDNASVIWDDPPTNTKRDGVGVDSVVMDTSPIEDVMDFPMGGEEDEDEDEDEENGEGIEEDIRLKKNLVQLQQSPENSNVISKIPFPVLREHSSLVDTCNRLCFDSTGPGEMIRGLDSLKPQTWLNDHVINKILSDHETEYAGSVDTVTMKVVVAETPPRWMHTPPRKRLAGLAEKQFLVMPLNIGELHWARYSFDSHTGILQWYDGVSCVPYRQEAIYAFLDWLYQGHACDEEGVAAAVREAEDSNANAYANAYANAGGVVPVLWKQKKEKKSLIQLQIVKGIHQRNTYDCGVILLDQATRFLQATEQYSGNRTKNRIRASTTSALATAGADMDMDLDMDRDVDTGARSFESAARRRLLSAQFTTSVALAPPELELFLSLGITDDRDRMLNFKVSHLAAVFQKFHSAATDLCNVIPGARAAQIVLGLPGFIEIRRTRVVLEASVEIWGHLMAHLHEQVVRTIREIHTCSTKKRKRDENDDGDDGLVDFRLEGYHRRWSLIQEWLCLPPLLSPSELGAPRHVSSSNVGIMSIAGGGGKSSSRATGSRGVNTMKGSNEHNLAPFFQTLDGMYTMFDASVKTLHGAGGSMAVVINEEMKRRKEQKEKEEEEEAKNKNRRVILLITILQLRAATRHFCHANKKMVMYKQAIKVLKS